MTSWAKKMPFTRGHAEFSAWLNIIVCRTSTLGEHFRTRHLAEDVLCQVLVEKHTFARFALSHDVPHATEGQAGKRCKRGDAELHIAMPCQLPLQLQIRSR